MPIDWKEKDEAYWAPRDDEPVQGYYSRLSKQLTMLCSTLIERVEVALEHSTLTPEAAARLIDSLGGEESHHISPTIMQDGLVNSELDSRKEDDATAGS